MARQRSTLPETFWKTLEALDGFVVEEAEGAAVDAGEDIDEEL
jgi:hypothetical protein